MTTLDVSANGQKILPLLESSSEMNTLPCVDVLPYLAMNIIKFKKMTYILVLITYPAGEREGRRQKLRDS